MISPKTCSIIAFICSLWFLLLGSMWVYLANVVLVFPIALLGFFLWRKGAPGKLHEITRWTMIIAVVISLATLALFR